MGPERYSRQGIMVKYIPQKGDIIYLDFGPQTGHEQRGKRPALIISNSTYNKVVGMVLACPITNNMRLDNLHVPLKKSQQTTGVVMCEQLKSLDIKTRTYKFKEKVHSETLNEVIDIIKSILK